MYGQIFSAIADGFGTVASGADKAVKGFFVDTVKKTVETGNVDALKNPVTTAVVLNPTNAPLQDLVIPAAAETEKAVEAVGGAIGGAVDTVSKYLPIALVGAGALFLLSKR